MSSSAARRARRASRNAGLTPEASFLLEVLHSRFGSREFSHDELVDVLAEVAGVPPAEMAETLVGFGEKQVH